MAGRKRCSAEDIVCKLRQADEPAAAGKTGEQNYRLKRLLGEAALEKDALRLACGRTFRRERRRRRGHGHELCAWRGGTHSGRWPGVCSPIQACRGVMGVCAEKPAGVRGRGRL